MVSGRIFKRERYLEKIRLFYNSDIIKVITYIRSCGKSFLMLSVIEELKTAGMSPKDIIYLNLGQARLSQCQGPGEAGS